MTSSDLPRVDAAEQRLAAISTRIGGFGVEALYLDPARRSVPPGLPDALYVNLGDPYALTVLYDVRVGRFFTRAWADWLERAEQAAGRAGDPLDPSSQPAQPRLRPPALG